MSDSPKSELDGRRELVLEEVSGNLPKNLFLSMRLAAAFGGKHARRVVVQRESRLSLEEPEWALIALLVQTPGFLAKRAIYAAFWTGALQYASAFMTPEAKEARQLWGVLAQQDLTTFFLLLPPGHS